MSYLFLLIVTLCSIVLYTLCQLLYGIVILKKRTKSIMGPEGVPILGSATIISRLAIQDQVRWILKQSLQFKDGLFKVWLGPEVVIMVTHPRHLEKILASSAHIEKTSFYHAVKPWLGEGLITSGGEEWFHDRKLITPTFHFSILKKYVPIMNEECQVMLRCIERKLEKSPGEPIEIYDIVIKCALDILCSSTMGIDVHAQEQDIPYCQALHRISQLMFQRMLRPWFKYKWIYLLSPAGREFYANLRIIHDFTRNVIRNRIEWRKTHKDELQNDNVVDEFGKRRKKALLDHLLDSSENHTIPLSEEKIRQQMDTFMFAGHDTTATAFAWLLFCIGNSEEHQEKVQEELDAVFGNSERPPTLNDLAELKYLDRVWKESLRMYPSVALFGRLLTEDVDIGDHVIPKGANIALSSIVTHRHPSVWEDPDKFDPDRFLPENMTDRNPYAYIPFSAGPRNCIGQKFAQIEEKIMAVHILRRWRIKSVLRHDQIEMSLPVVLKPLNGLYFYLTPRKQSAS